MKFTAKEIEDWTAASDNDLSNMIAMALSITEDDNLPHQRARDHAAELVKLLKPVQIQLGRLDRSLSAT